MRKLLLLLLCAVIVIPAGPANAEAPLKVLFIGNSYTSVNDLPGLLRELASTAGERPIETASVVAPGATLQLFWDKGEAVTAIRRTRWDFVVLQEQSSLPVRDAERMNRFVRLFETEIKKSGAQTVLFLTWARAGNPGMQIPLTRAYTALADEIGALLAPVGPAWQRTLEESAVARLYQDDGSHPTLLGSYVAACVLYAVIYRKPVEKPARQAAKLSASDTVLAHRVAWDVVAATPRSRRN